MGMINKKAVIGVGVVAFAGLAGSALAASNTLPATSYAGQGLNTSVPAGYTVTGLKFGTAMATTTSATLNYVNSANFSIFRGAVTTGTSADSDTVLIQLRAGTTGTTWSQCGAGSSGARTCSITNSTVTLENMDSVAIVAYGS